MLWMLWMPYRCQLTAGSQSSGQWVDDAQATRCLKGVVQVPSHLWVRIPVTEHHRCITRQLLLSQVNIEICELDFTL